MLTIIQSDYYQNDIASSQQSASEMQLSFFFQLKQLLIWQEMIVFIHLQVYWSRHFTLNTS